MATELFFPWTTPDPGLLVFASPGRVDEPRSCAVQCRQGYFRLTQSQKCVQHSTPTCSAEEYLRAGNHERDAQCTPCSGCAAQRRVANCTRTTNDRCESCGPLGPHQRWESTMQQDCSLACTANFQLNRQTLACEVCTSKCAPGTRPPEASHRMNCSHCETCTSKPPNSLWLTQEDRFDCAWECEPQHALVGDACVKWADVFNDAPSFTPPPTTCAAGSTLVEFKCTPCFDAVPQAQLPLLQDIGTSWTWLAGCHWQCRYALGFTPLRSESGKHWTCEKAKRRSLFLEAADDSWVADTRQELTASPGASKHTSAKPARRFLSYTLLFVAVAPVLLLKGTLLVHCLRRCKGGYATAA